MRNPAQIVRLTNEGRSEAARMGHNMGTGKRTLSDGQKVYSASCLLCGAELVCKTDIPFSKGIIVGRAVTTKCKSQEEE